MSHKGLFHSQRSKLIYTSLGHWLTNDDIRLQNIKSTTVSKQEKKDMHFLTANNTRQLASLLNISPLALID